MLIIINFRAFESLKMQLHGEGEESKDDGEDEEIDVPFAFLLSHYKQCIYIPDQAYDFHCLNTFIPVPTPL